MDAAHTIRDALARVSTLRTEAMSNPNLHTAIKAVKRFQARRFSGTYADLQASADYGSAARFFLEELYSDSDYSLRDAQFARIAGALQTFFPHQVVATAVSLAQLHALTEELDHQMAAVWAHCGSEDEADPDFISRYMCAWKTIGRSEDRTRQLEVVLEVGAELDQLTRTRGLRLMLKMMHRPAMAAGLGSLQHFLEMGFDTFAGMSGRGERAREFLALVRQRESLWLSRLFSSDSVLCESELRDCLALAK